MFIPFLMSIVHLFNKYGLLWYQLHKQTVQEVSAPFFSKLKISLLLFTGGAPSIVDLLILYSIYGLEGRGEAEMLNCGILAKNSH